ncbi:sigma-70 family RNA polymerase sigma factor [Devosia epidermidihirudinis]|uniref:sigma-70 family RNA polymerase sigma factor n=1 Tax=Devosia epidermidihirudinis TaxID=1293439 RepID=UPI000A4D8474|nr:sigma-70 family RNA polymerase sigma factor [Devosia epidermidihirudinis]
MVPPDDMDATDPLSDLLVAVGTTRDMEAFQTLFRHFAPRIKSYMARGATSALQPDEIMQETMVAVWNKAALYDPTKGSASTWIFTIARNQRIDAYRRATRPEFDPNDPAFVPSSEPAADDRMQTQQTSKSLRRAIETLSTEQSEVLRLCYFEDNSQSTIAERLNIPLGTVKSRLRLAFAKLRLALEASGDAP